MPYTISRTFFLTDEEVRMERRLATMRANRTNWAGTLATLNGRVVRNDASAVKGLYR